MTFDSILGIDIFPNIMLDTKQQDFATFHTIRHAYFTVIIITKLLVLVNSQSHCKHIGQ